MKILMVNALFPPDRTGSSIFTDQLTKSLSDAGHDVHVLCSSSAFNYRGSMDEPNVTRLRSRRIKVGKFAWHYSIPLNFSRRNYKAAKRLTQQFGPDVIVCHGQIFDLTWMMSVVARRLAIPAVVVAHTAIWNESRFRRFVLRVFERVVIKPLLRAGKPAFVAVDKWTLNDVGRVLAKGKQVEVIPVSVDCSKVINGDESIARDRYDLPDGPIILSLGHVIALRNRHTLVRALPDILKQHPDINVVVAGDVKDDSMLNLAKELGVDASILCLGSVPHEDIKHLLAASLLEVHDLQGLGLGITSVEAMCAGIPIIASVSDDNYPGISLNSFEGLMLLLDVSPMELSGAVNTLLKDDDRRDEAIAAQHRLVHEIYNPDAIAKRYEDVFWRLLLRK